MKKIVHKEDLNKNASLLLKKVINIKTDKARLIAMSGDLGSGKTTFTQEIAKELGIKEFVNSPTFVIMKIYKINSKSKYFKLFKNLIHIDAYRLKNDKDLLNIGWEGVCNNKENLIILEWPENVKDCLGKETVFVYLKHKTEETRILEY